jgi:hypothetical protein
MSTITVGQLVNICNNFWLTLNRNEQMLWGSRVIKEDKNIGAFKFVDNKRCEFLYNSDILGHTEEQIVVWIKDAWNRYLSNTIKNKKHIANDFVLTESLSKTKNAFKILASVDNYKCVCQVKTGYTKWIENRILDSISIDEAFYVADFAFIPDNAKPLQM